VKTNLVGGIASAMPELNKGERKVGDVKTKKKREGGRRMFFTT